MSSESEPPNEEDSIIGPEEEREPSPEDTVVLSKEELAKQQEELKERAAELARQIESFRKKIEGVNNFEELFSILQEEGHQQAVERIIKAREELKFKPGESKDEKGLYELIKNKKSSGKNLEDTIEYIKKSNEDLFKWLNLSYDEGLNEALKNKVVDLFKEEAERELEKEQKYKEQKSLE